MNIVDKVKLLIRNHGGIKEPALKRISFPVGVLGDGKTFEILLYLTPMPTHAVLDCIKEDLEYFSEAR